MTIVPVGSVLLWSFQPLARVADLETDGELVGSWERLPRDLVTAGYREMVAAMARARIDTHGRPPVWAWGGRCGVTLSDAHSLLPDQLRDGYATVEFDAPAELVLATRYGPWNDYLYEVFQAGSTAGVPRAWDVPTPVEDELVQVCLPILRAEWVREIRPLPRSEADDIDWSALA
jgi:hypothetical protein